MQNNTEEKTNQKQNDVNKLEDGLNPQQIEAIKHLDGPALVVAGPGSGKTRVLTNRVAYLIKMHDVPETNILCVTFTNKAAGEIKTRVQKLLSDSGTKMLAWSGTFHSICSKILRKHGYKIGIQPSFVIYDSDDQQSLIKNIMKDFGIDTKQINPKATLSTISSAKSELLTRNEYLKYAQGYFQRTVAKIYPEYQRRLRINNALDFDDLLMETVSLFEKDNKTLKHFQSLFQYILVDEYQDTNKSQYVLTKLLAEGHQNIFVVGDMSQAIYSFRGADYRNILNFQRDYPNAKIYNLEQNYRSTQNILDSAKHVIKNNSTHIPLDLWTKNGDGEKLTLYTGSNEHSEAAFVTEQMVVILSTGKTYRDLAVLYRTNAQSRNMEEHLIKNNIPYRIIGGLRFYARKEVKDIVAFLRIVHNQNDSVSWERIINIPPRGIGKKTLEEVKATNWDLNHIEEKTKLPIRKWVEMTATHGTLEIMDKILADTKYIEWLDTGTEEDKIRIENIKELGSVAVQFTDLAEFLENVALIESSDKPNMEEKDVVTLMTVHASKGLEFPAVFIIGMEEGLFPHSQSSMEISELEEERRLCYVAITRAMEKVYLTNALSRTYFGNVQSNIPSRFLSEIPEDFIEKKGDLLERGRGFGRMGKNKSGSNFGNNGGYGNGGGYNNKQKNADSFMDDLEYNRNNFHWD
ncbi:UvrD-helicase domain-containing protein [candidate division WWE3 bacterium]|nr:UvrD-helicase domain-containing protein [candidate division WWE3 bacterium]